MGELQIIAEKTKICVVLLHAGNLPCHPMKDQFMRDTKVASTSCFSTAETIRTTG
jgi:hypothetical protein